MGAPLSLAPIHPKPYNPLLALLWIETVIPGASYCLPSVKGLRGAGFCSSCFGSSLPGGKGNQKPIWAIYRRLSGGAGRQILPLLLTPIYGWGFGDRT